MGHKGLISLCSTNGICAWDAAERLFRQSLEEEFYALPWYRILGSSAAHGCSS